MRWIPGGTSGDIEDRREEGGGGFGGFGFGGFHIGLGGMLILLVLSLIFHRNLFTLLGGGGASTSVSQPDRARDAEETPTVQFVSFVLDDTPKDLGRHSSAAGNSLSPRQAGALSKCTYSGCGQAQAATRSLEKEYVGKPNAKAG